LALENSQFGFVGEIEIVWVEMRTVCVHVELSIRRCNLLILVILLIILLLILASPLSCSHHFLSCSHHFPTRSDFSQVSRRARYAGILTRVRVAIIQRMAKPEEVLIVEVICDEMSCDLFCQMYAM